MKKPSRMIGKSAVGALIVAGILFAAVRLRANSTDGRFMAVSAGVLDQVTGLTWQEPDDGNVYIWSDAQTHCASPWRLPTLEELFTLMDVRAATSPYIDSVFTNASAVYWSATPVAGAAYSWYVDFGAGGFVSSYSNSSTFRVRCVQ
jgi:hypothetical protein